ncbi:MAG: DNA-processing protein DprA [Clostridia bacterium]|nr:DNA-processing protein DprA [Clostridia bacterium]
MDERCYWLWLQYAVKPAAKLKDFYLQYHTAENFYQAGPDEWKSFFGNKKNIFNRCKEKSPEDFAHIVEFCDKHSLVILTPESEHYPKKLLDIEDFPAVLFVRGDYKCLNEGPSFAVIGSRTPCVYGEDAAREIVKGLSENGALVVSGGALGIDSVAHKSAIEAGGKTVLIMGCGHGYGYLPENAQLRKSVTRQGAVVSEYPPFTPVERNTFPQRNRIISGMSDAVVIIEAAELSGTFSTANHAKRQKRKLFVLPGDIKSGHFDGSNRLITEGAEAVFSDENIFAKCGLLDKAQRVKGDKSGEAFKGVSEKSSECKKISSKSKKKKQKITEENKSQEKNSEKTQNIIKNLPAGISKNAEIVYNIMSDGISELDEIKRNSELEVRHILAALTELEILGFAEAYAPNCYRTK